MRERRYGAKGERACKLNCKFYCKLDYKYTCKYTYKYLEFFRKGGRGNEGWCGSAYKYTYNLTYKYLEFFPKGKGNLWKGERERGFGFFSVFRGLSPRSLTRKPTYNKTCNPTYNPSYCPHTSDVARGGTAIGTFGMAELWLGKHGGEEQSFR